MYFVSFAQKQQCVEELLINILLICTSKANYKNVIPSTCHFWFQRTQIGRKFALTVLSSALTAVLCSSLLAYSFCLCILYLYIHVLVRCIHLKISCWRWQQVHLCYIHEFLNKQTYLVWNWVICWFSPSVDDMFVIIPNTAIPLHEYATQSEVA